MKCQIPVCFIFLKQELLVPQNTCKQTKHLEQKKTNTRRLFSGHFMHPTFGKNFLAYKAQKTHLGRGTQLLFFFFKALSFAFPKLGSLFIFSYIIIIYCFFSLEIVPSYMSSCTYLKLFFVNVYHDQGASAMITKL